MSLGECSVMVVEDHEFQRSTTLQILANLGITTLYEAADGEDALLQLQLGCRPDVVICDLDMPGIDGIEFLRCVAELGGPTAVVIASGLDWEVLSAAEATAKSLGLVVLGTIAKPLTARRLLQTVGLHRPQTQARQIAGADAVDDPWRVALAEARVGVRARPRVEVRSGRLRGLEIRAHRLDEQDGVILDAARDRAGPRSATVALAVLSQLAEAGLDAQRRLAIAGEPLDVTLVLPGAALLNDDLLEHLSAVVEQHDLEPPQVCVAVADVEAAQARLELLTRLRVRGFRLGFDGFGRADATLPALSGLPLTEVTIDAEVMARAAASSRGVDALGATVQLLGDRGYAVVCDGCAGPAEWLIATQSGCDRVQGPLVGPELAPEDVVTWLRGWHGVPVT